MKYRLIFILLLITGSCTNTGTENQADKNNNDTLKDYDTGTSTPEDAVSSCYENISGNDSVFLSIFHESKVITGSLIYNFYEKDKNSGTLRGNMYGDTLIADYIFKSEGTTSVREVAFLKKDDSFIEGYGDVEEQYGKMVFKNRSMIDFTGKPLHKVDCNGY